MGTRSPSAYCAVHNSGYFASKSDRRIFFSRKKCVKIKFGLISLRSMPAMPKARSKPSRTSLPSVKARSNQEKEHVQREKRAKEPVPITESESDNEMPDTSNPAKRKPSTPTPIEYLLTACTFVGKQSVYRESTSMRVGFWSAKRYLEESTIRVGNTANELGIEPVLHTSTATVCSKSMKQSDYITCDVNTSQDWYKVESVVTHLAKSLSKGIRVDLVIKYHAKQPAKDVDDADSMEVMEFDENAGPTPKCLRKVARAHMSITDIIDCYHGLVG